MNNLLNSNLLETWFYLFLLLTPFCGLVIFSIICVEMTRKQKLKSLIQIVIIVLVCTLTLFSFGQRILTNLNIELDTLRVGAGILLFLTGLKLIDSKLAVDDKQTSSFIIPLCIPVIIGPATTSALIVLSAENGINIHDLLAIVLACLSLGILFLIGDLLQAVIGKNGIDILSKLNGLYMIIIATQLILLGLQNSFQVIPKFAVQ